MHGKLIVDAGANVGIFSIYCAMVLGAAKIYAFEPLPQTYEKLVANVEKNGAGGIVVPVNAALGDENRRSMIYFDKEGSCGATLKPERNTGFGKTGVDIVTLDSFLSSGSGRLEKIDFIKMDIEGWERHVLIGAANTIARDAPVLAVAAYHEKDDRALLPDLITAINCSYKVRLLMRNEAVLYCEPGKR